MESKFIASIKEVDSRTSDHYQNNTRHLTQLITLAFIMFYQEGNRELLH